MKTRLYLILVFLLTFSANNILRAQEQPNRKLEQAIAVLRHIDQDKLDEAQREKKAQEIDAAWETIQAAGKPGVALLKAEIRRVEEGKEKDDFFKLNAATLLWMIGRFDEVETIAAIWNSTPLKVQYQYVFLTAFDAAKTHDERVLPMLLACLKDKEGSMVVPLHSLELEWPLNHQFLWGAFGSKGIPALLKVLNTSQNPVELESAMLLLTRAQEVKALPRIREIAVSMKGETSHIAVNSLGIFGHPQDFDFLVSGLRSSDARKAFAHAYALYEYEDLRAVPLLIPLLKNENEFLRRETGMALLHLTTPSSLDALQRFCDEALRTRSSHNAQQGECSIFKDKLTEMGLELLNYAKASAQEKAAQVANVIKRREEPYLLSKEDRQLKQEQVREVAQEWIKNHRAFGGKSLSFEELPEKDGKKNQVAISLNKYSWVEERHILSAATPDDINLMLDVKAALYSRLSDECLYETERIDEIIKRLGRSRYRKVVGLTNKVE